MTLIQEVQGLETFLGMILLMRFLMYGFRSNFITSIIIPTAIIPTTERTTQVMPKIVSKPCIS